MIYVTLTQQIIDLWNSFISAVSSLDWKLILMFILFAFLFGTIIALIVGFVISKSSDRKFENSVLYASYTARIVRVNLSENIVTFFNMATMRKVRNVRYDDYISSFGLKDQEAIREWFKSIIEGTNTGQYLEAEVTFRRERKQAPSFLKLSKVDREKKIIHLESHLIRYHEMSELKNRELSSISDFNEELAKNGTTAGMTFCFTLAPKANNSNDVIDMDKFRNNLSVDVVNRFKKTLFAFIRGNQQKFGGCWGQTP